MQLFNNFLNQEEIDYLLKLWDKEKASGWNLQMGNKNYRFVPCVNARRSLLDKVLFYLPQVRFDRLLYTDSFFLQYRNGGWTKRHTDTRSGSRMNFLLKKPEKGVLVIEGKEVALEVGDGVLFSPDTERHEVTRVKGERLVWTVGRTRTPEYLPRADRKEATHENIEGVVGRDEGITREADDLAAEAVPRRSNGS